MEQESDRIKHHIEEQREEIGQRLSILQQRMKDATDWRKRFNSKPFAALAGAFGFGMVLALTSGGRSPRSRYYAARQYRWV